MSNAAKTAHAQLDAYNIPRTAEERETGDTLHLSLTQRIVLLKKSSSRAATNAQPAYSQSARNH